VGNPHSFPGNQRAADIIQALAKEMGDNYIVQVVGVDTTLVDMSTNGSLLDQIKAVAAACDALVYVSNLIVYVISTYAKISDVVVRINKDTGMVGYPTPTMSGVVVRTLYNSAYNPGTSVQVESSVDICNGKWVILAVQHSLSSLTINGDWFSTITARGALTK
jgi:hypothetical protein